MFSSNTVSSVYPMSTEPEIPSTFTAESNSASIVTILTTNDRWTMLSTTHSLLITLISDSSVTSNLLDKSLVGGYETYPLFLEDPPSLIKLLCNSEVTLILPDTNDK